MERITPLDSLGMMKRQHALSHALSLILRATTAITETSSSSYLLIMDIDGGKYGELLSGMTNDKRKIFFDALEVLIHSIDDVAALFGVPLNSLKDIDEFTKDLKYVDINTKSTSYAGAAGASAKDQPKVNSNFRHLVADLVFDGVNIGKRMAFPVVEYYAKNNWVKHGLKRIMMNSKGFLIFKFNSQAGLEAVLEGSPWLIRKSLIILKNGRWIPDCLKKN
ncbi:zinc knuckle CX2CX4HX4C containing protein [Tanacetum coccineum]|uniref:Zinc knuckle CX2CX4HX4C containing protein n=1 Tax=Tanacetum coccineum TaxID=301880 RepID=A0ABQ4WIV5_9ASTR